MTVNSEMGAELPAILMITIRIIYYLSLGSQIFFFEEKI